jgi:hypothetical protein
MSLTRRGALFAGALFAGALFGPGAPQVQAEEPAGGHWKHLIRAISSAETPEVSVQGDIRFSVERPVTCDLRASANTLALKVSGSSRFAVLAPYTHAVAGSIHADLSPRWHIKHPKCAAAPAFLHTSVTVLGFTEFPVAACETPRARFGATGYYTFATPVTVQNPTEEMLLELLR